MQQDDDYRNGFLYRHCKTEEQYRAAKARIAASQREQLERLRRAVARDELRGNAAGVGDDAFLADPGDVSMTSAAGPVAAPWSLRRCQG